MTEFGKINEYVDGMDFFIVVGKYSATTHLSAIEPAMIH